MSGTQRTGSTVSGAPEFYTLSRLLDLPQVAQLDEETRFAMRVVGSVFAVRANSYVVEELIDWGAVPDDPIFRIIFPRREMLGEEIFDRVAAALRAGAPAKEIAAIVRSVREGLNPHPAGQTTLNVPLLEGRPVPGIQHKYERTVLYFPSEGQTCHAYCSFCFRWPQFTGDKDYRMASTETEALVAYLREHREVSDVLITGGDPMIMKTKRLERLFDALRTPELDHIRSIRIGTKALSWWPYRFLTDPDADALLDALRRLSDDGKHVAIMAHVNHPQEFSKPARTAVGRLRATGATIRSQSPLLAGVNDDPHVWSRMWAEQVSLGMVPYYMFLVRDTGARSCFDVPLARAHRIFARAAQDSSGLARTVRGPSMSTEAGKIEILGREHVAGEDVFVLRFLQGRDPRWAYRPFFARFDEDACWIDELKPAFGEQRFFFQKG